MSLYAVSDLHGQFNTFIEGIESMGITDRDELYVIGDAIDRGPDGIKLLEYIKDHDNMDLILGNHEFLMLNSVDPDGKKQCRGHDSALWLYYNGGDCTYEKYEKLSLKSRKELLEWLNSRFVIKTVKVNNRKFCLTHSYFIPGCENKTYSELNYRDVWNIVWKSIFRDERDTHGEDIYGGFDYTFITGHVPVQRILSVLAPEDETEWFKVIRRGNFADIDGGCAFGVYPGVRTGALFLRLDDMREFPVLLRE